jgi:hypothetical protein
MNISRNLSALLAGCAMFVGSTAGAQSSGARVDASSPPAGDIDVVGTRPAPAAAPSVTGSRIAREPTLQFRTVASTNVAGLTPESGMDPFAGGTRIVVESLCRSDNPRLSEGAACRLVPIQRLIATGAHDEALSALDRFAASETATAEEKYVAAALQYRIAEARGESADREEALRAMLATAAMPAASRPAALRTLVSLALRRGDSVAAGALLAELLSIAPEDTRSLVNLAAIRAEAGERGEAATLVGRAIEIARRRGEPVPAEWLSFAAAAH